MEPFVSDKNRVRQNHLSRWVRPGCQNPIVRSQSLEKVEPTFQGAYDGS